MNTVKNFKICLACASLVMSLATVQAQPHRHWRHGHRVVTVVNHPATTVHTINKLSQKERFAMAMAFIDNNKYISVKQYAKMTGLKKDTAEAELDAFARDKTKPITTVIVRKKKLYTRI